MKSCKEGTYGGQIGEQQQISFSSHLINSLMIQHFLVHPKGQVPAENVINKFRLENNWILKYCTYVKHSSKFDITVHNTYSIEQVGFFLFGDKMSLKIKFVMMRCQTHRMTQHASTAHCTSHWRACGAVCCTTIKRCDAHAHCTVRTYTCIHTRNGNKFEK